MRCVVYVGELKFTLASKFLQIFSRLRPYNVFTAQQLLPTFGLQMNT